MIPVKWKTSNKQINRLPEVVFSQFPNHLSEASVSSYDRCRLHNSGTSPAFLSTVKQHWNYSAYGLFVQLEPTKPMLQFASASRSYLHKASDVLWYHCASINNKITQRFCKQLFILDIGKNKMQYNSNLLNKDVFVMIGASKWCYKMCVWLERLEALVHLCQHLFTEQ